MDPRLGELAQRTPNFDDLQAALNEFAAVAEALEAAKTAREEGET